MGFIDAITFGPRSNPRGPSFVCTVAQRIYRRVIPTTGSEFQTLGAISTPYSLTHPSPLSTVPHAINRHHPFIQSIIHYHPYRYLPTLSCLGYITLQRFRFFFFRALLHTPTGFDCNYNLSYTCVEPSSFQVILLLFANPFLQEIDLTLTGATEPPTLQLQVDSFSQLFSTLQYSLLARFHHFKCQLQLFGPRTSLAASYRTLKSISARTIRKRDQSQPILQIHLHPQSHRTLHWLGARAGFSVGSDWIEFSLPLPYLFKSTYELGRTR